MSKTPTFPASCAVERSQFERIRVTGPKADGAAALAALHEADFNCTRCGARGDGTASFLHIAERMIEAPVVEPAKPTTPGHPTPKVTMRVHNRSWALFTDGGGGETLCYSGIVPDCAVVTWFPHLASPVASLVSAHSSRKAAEKAAARVRRADRRVADGHMSVAVVPITMKRQESR